jgi:hypothetical protein
MQPVEHEQSMMAMVTVMVMAAAAAAIPSLVRR